MSPRPSNWARLAQGGLVAAALALSSGCSDDDTVAPQDPVEDPRKTIAGTMQELKVAIRDRDLDRYSKLFDPDFVFVFDPMDVLEHPDLPQNWDWAAERRATRNMFESDLVEHIHADFITGSPVPADTGDVGIREFPRGTMKVLVTEVRVDVDTRDPTGGENIIYRIRDVQETFFLYPDSLEIVEGVPAWKIFEWRERRFGPVPTISVTWGLVKANYE